MYSEHLRPMDLVRMLEAHAPSPAEVMDLVSANTLDLTAVARLLLAVHDEASRKAVVTAASRRREQIWQKHLFLMPPLYVSDGDPNFGGCLDHCVYCPWRHGNVPEEQLVRLCPEEVRDEVAYLVGLGYGDVELVAATDPELLDARNAARVVTAAHAAGARNVGVNFFPLRHVDDYRSLAAAGCTFSIVWQETYNQDTYRRQHPRGPKANMRFRLDAHDRALQAGIQTVGVAFLGGLANWSFEVLATIDHAHYLRKEYGANVIFGMPRWKGAAGMSRPEVSDYRDDEYEFVGALYSLSVPESLPWFSTREPFDLSARCATGGGCLFTLDCSTEVGGYTRNGGNAQFPVYSQSFDLGSEWLRSLGYSPQVHLPWEG